MMHQIRFPLLATLCVLIAACSPAPSAPQTSVQAPGATENASNAISAGDNDPESATGDNAASGPAAAEATSSTAKIPLEIRSWEQVQEWIAGQRGKLVVIDVWSTSCVECVREFPHFVEFHKQFGDRVACASLSVDYYGGEGSKPEDVQPQVRKFLESRQATMPNFLSSDTDETVLQKIETASIPASLVFDQEGKLHKVFNNDQSEYGPEGFNYANHIRPFVEELLGK